MSRKGNYNERYKKRHDPWVTGGILRSLSKQKRLYQEALVTNVGSGKTLAYKLYKANLQHIIRKNKQHFLHTKCVEFGSNAKEMWQLIKKVIKKENNKTNLIDSLTKGDIILTEEKDIANEFGDYFASVGKNIAHQTKESKGIEHYLDKVPTEKSSLFLYPTTRTEIRKIIGNLKSKTSSGYDGIIIFY